MDIIGSETSKNASILTIGPAADNLIAFATALAEGGASASGGMGSVMGSKNLKGIAVDGDRKIQVANPTRLREITDYVKSVMLCCLMV